MWTLLGGPDWMPITPNRGSFLHADSHYFRREASTGSSLRSIGNCFTWANPANSARSFSAWAAVWPVLCSLCGKALRRGLNIGMEKR